MKVTKAELFTIPNLMGYFRILMIPVFSYLYLTGHHTASVVVIIISSVTDMFDGKIARKFNMVTDFGKMLDPIADKLTHAALAVCLATKYPLMWIVIVLMVIKEGYMAIEGLANIKQGNPIEGAKIYGKICTAYLFVMLIVLVLFQKIPQRLAVVLIMIGIFIMAQTLVLYIFDFTRKKRGNKNDGNKQ